MGLSRTLTTTEKGTLTITSANMLASKFKEGPLSIILLRNYNTGFLIKSYYQIYKVVYGFKTPQIVVTRSNSDFNKLHEKNIGMSILRRNEKEESISFVPMPPGSLYIGNLAFGNWRLANSGQKVWTFHHAYRNFYRLFGWGDFRPSIKFYEKLLVYQNQGMPFYGNKNEFGTDGTITRKEFSNFFLEHKKERKSFLELLKKLL